MIQVSVIRVIPRPCLTFKIIVEFKGKVSDKKKNIRFSDILFVNSLERIN